MPFVVTQFVNQFIWYHPFFRNFFNINQAFSLFVTNCEYMTNLENDPETGCEKAVKKSIETVVLNLL